MIKILRDLFGEQLENNFDKMLLGLSKAPKTEKRLDDDEEDEVDYPMELDDFVTLVSNKSGLSESDGRILDALSRRVFVYDPREKGNRTWVKRVELLEQVKILPKVENPQDVFQTVLTAEDEDVLGRIAHALQSRVSDLLEEYLYEQVSVVHVPPVCHTVCLRAVH